VKSTYNHSKKLLASITKVERKRLGLSQEAFADACGIDRTYASQIERGIANPSLEVLCRIADALEISLTDLLSKHSS
jgi:transcriptional regulator with XRE-family HTH domain